ncbi:MAG: peptide-methionine (S)-S-oxide reductase MsrA [Spirochaetales bacterium]|nr:peptide-methionine (S)-S-oxide reductase MsrA [Spirochaetales bacterium]
MKKIVGLILALTLGFMLWAQGNGEKDGVVDEPDALVIREALPDWEGNYSESEVERAVLAGGCYWGVEAVFEQLQGVLDVDSGYSGGSAETAFYKQVGTGLTGHAEAVEIVYDPNQISYETLLEVFFMVAHDPTQLNYQGPDVGSEYRSAIFYLDDSQRRAAEGMIDQLGEDKVYPKPIVTEVVPLEAFYEAEDYHQDFLRLYPNQPYVAYWDIPKLEHLREAYPGLIFE